LYQHTVEILDRVLKNENTFFRTPAYFKKFENKKVKKKRFSRFRRGLLDENGVFAFKIKDPSKK
jgi:hypothetical protein